MRQHLAYVAAVTTDLTAWVADQIDRSQLDDEAGMIVLTALEGDQALDDCLAGGSSTVATGTPDTAPQAVTAGGTFLKSIIVEGFRGIGPQVTLELEPAPGLTVIAGRNGSGKSSIAEALELVLTGGTYRWKQKSAVWKDHWRNLHQTERARVCVEVVEEGSGPISITRTWPSGSSDIEAGTTKVQRTGKKQQDGMDTLGWARPLEQFRPLLSYDELGGLLEGNPSELHDALASVLGVEQLTDGLKRIQSRLKERKAPGAAATQARKTLAGEASALTDERAATALTLLNKTSPDVAALRSLATGVVTADRGPLGALRELAALAAPCTEESAMAVAESLRLAVAGLADAGAEAAGRRVARLSMKQHALELHAEHGEMSCPVCSGSLLDEEWAVTTRIFVKTEQDELQGISDARDALAVALSSARRYIRPRPAALDRSPVPEVEVADARQAWTAWAAAPVGDNAAVALALADHLEQHVEQLVEALAGVRTAAVNEVSARDDLWEPLAARIAAWCGQWDAWLAAKADVDVLARAELWLKENDKRLKDERLEPISQGARAAWAKLRQESNVELGALTLAGSATRRHVRIESTVDGTNAGSIAVLSQGELHALALALFLPRATMAQSPFRFLVLDDPIQAMDPAKVDGLVSLLSELAKDRQVIVLSHDDRLPDAVRRTEVAATVIQVNRGQGSNVSLEAVQDPATRYLADAFALIKDDRLPEATLRRVLPGLLRFAVESAARTRFFSTQLGTGKSLPDVEADWEQQSSTRDRVSLAIYGEVKNLDGWATAPYRKHGLRNVGTAMHNGLKAELTPIDAARDVERLVADVRAGSK